MGAEVSWYKVANEDVLRCDCEIMAPRTDLCIPISDLSYAADTIAETDHGISGQKIVTYSNHFASSYRVPIPYAVYPFLSVNKRTALLKNLCAFDPHIQYALVLQLCDDPKLAENEPVHAVRKLFVERYGHHARPGATHALPASVPLPAPASLVPPWVKPAEPLAQEGPMRPYEIFISYSHDDEELMNFVRQHLVVYDRQNRIRKWWDRKLMAGTKINPEIQHKLGCSDIVILIVSSSFLASDYCYEIEMSQALKQDAAGRSVVVPVIVRPCAWKDTPLKDLLALPTDGRALTSWPNRDEGALDIAVGIMRTVAELQKRQANPPRG